MAYEILIPIFNAGEYVRACVESVLQFTDSEHPIVLLDDASTDSTLVRWLDQIASNPQVTVIHHPKRLGFVKNANFGLARTHRNVILLNSDTRVTKGWLERLDRCRRSDPSIGIISPLSNNALFLSVPFSNLSNTNLPEDFPQWIDESSEKRYTDIPTGLGFCFLVTRECLDLVGKLDEQYRDGYGEEADLSMRAIAKGFRTVCCDDCFVYHEGSRSFSELPELGGLRSRNSRIFHLFWPEHHVRVVQYLSMNPLGPLRRKLQDRLSGHSATHNF